MAPLYNITLVLPDGRRVSFQTTNATVNGKPPTELNHTIILSQGDVERLKELAKNPDAGVCHFELMLVKTVGVADGGGLKSKVVDS